MMRGSQNLFPEDVDSTTSSSDETTSVEAFSSDDSSSRKLNLKEPQGDGLRVVAMGNATDDDDDEEDEPKKKKKGGMSWWAIGVTFLGGVASMAAMFTCLFKSSGEDVVDEGDVAAAGAFPTTPGGGGGRAVLPPRRMRVPEEVRNHHPRGE